MTRSAIPRPALILGLGGLLPFFLSTTLVVMSSFQGETAIVPTHFAVLALGAYGAVILSFLGGVRWGRLLSDDTETEIWVPLTLSIVPSLIAWPALMFPPAVMLSVLAAGFVYQFIRDRNAVERGELPDWYGRLRFILTVGAVLSLMLPVIFTSAR